MIAFWAIVTLMSAVVAAALVIPLLGKARSARDRREYDLAVYRDQLGEVDRDVARGVLADDQARATRTEIERRILAAAEDESPSGGDVPRPAAGLAPAQSTWALALTVAVLIPAGVDDAAIRSQLLHQFGIEIGAGLGPVKGKTWRIGLMGHASNQRNVLLFLAALERCLSDQGLAVSPGAGVAAANGAHSGQS